MVSRSTSSARLLSLLVLPLVGCRTLAPLPTPTVGVPELLQDAEVLEKTYRALHPGLLRSNTPAELDARFAALRAELRQAHSLEQAYLAFSVFAATLKCGHTYANFSNQGERVKAAILDKPGRVPFEFRWLPGGRMVVTKNHSAALELVRGTEVFSLNDVPVATILARLMTIARADGANDAKRLALLEVQGLERYETFDVFWPLFFPSSSTTVRADVRPPGQQRRTLELPLLTAAQRQAKRAEGSVGDGPVWTLTTLDARTALLRMPTWALYDSTWNWQGFLDETFDALVAKKTPRLVIDLRGNEGGLSVGNSILARLTAKDLPLEQFERVVQYRRVPTELLANLRTWDKSFEDWGEAARPRPDGRFRLVKYDDTETGDLVRPKGPRFEGRVFVLIDANNSSATFEFAQQVQQARLGTLVGEPTGGNQRGINGGAFFFLTLPHSGIELDVPLIGQFPKTPRPDAGLVPDVVVARSLADLVAGRDAALEAVIAAP